MGADRDVLELANDEEFGDGGMDDMENEVEDEVVSKLKDKAKRRKGRGFTGGRGEDRDEGEYERVEGEEMGEPGPQRSIEGWILFVTGSTRRRRRTTSMTSSRSMARSRTFT